MNVHPKITIITPSFNQGNYIEETILSVINQGYPNLEYIIIDGGSTDNTVDVIKKYADKITYWVSEKDRGQSHAINKGLKLATGEIINWLNSDDLLLPGKLKVIAEHFFSNPSVMMVYGRIEYFGNGPSYYSVNHTLKNISSHYIAHICMPQPACFFRKKLIDEQGYLDEGLHFSMDTDLYVRAGLHYKILQIDEVISKFRLHVQSKSISSFNKIFLEDNKAIFSRVLVTIDARKAIMEMKEIGLFVKPNYSYNKTVKFFNENLVLFYFLEHRLFTLHNQNDKIEFKRLFKVVFYNHFFHLMKSPKLLLYRCFLFLPADFLHSIARWKNKSTGKLVKY